MALANFCRSTPARVLCVIVGFGLIAYGGTHVSLAGLILMMVGMVPAVTGLAGLCLRDEVVKPGETVDELSGHTREGRV